MASADSPVFSLITPTSRSILPSARSRSSSVRTPQDSLTRPLSLSQLPSILKLVMSAMGHPSFEYPSLNAYPGSGGANGSRRTFGPGQEIDQQPVDLVRTIQHQPVTGVEPLVPERAVHESSRFPHLGFRQGHVPAPPHPEGRNGDAWDAPDPPRLRVRPVPVEGRRECSRTGQVLDVLVEVLLARHEPPEQPPVVTAQHGLGDARALEEQHVPGPSGLGAPRQR